MRRTLRVSILLASLLAVSAFMASAVHSLIGARPADPAETAILERAERIVRHGPAYTSGAGAASIAMPGFPYLVALVANGDPPRVWIPRALALTATFFVGLLVLVIVSIETQSWTVAVAAASFALFGQGLFCSVPGAARPESIALLSVLLGFSAFRFTVGILGALLGAVLLAAAFFIDQRAAWFIAAAGFSLAVTDRRRFLAFTLGTGILVGGGYFALSGLLGPWFNFAAWDEPLGALRFRPGRALRFAVDQMLGRLGICTLVTVLSFGMSTQPWHGKRGIWMCLGVAAILGGLMSTQSATFDRAALIPSIVALSLIGPLSLHRVARHLSATLDTDPRNGEGVVLMALMLQLVVFGSLARDAAWLSDTIRAGLLGA
jgi:hypothetical protein